MPLATPRIQPAGNSTSSAGGASGTTVSSAGVSTFSAAMAGAGSNKPAETDLTKIVMESLSTPSPTNSKGEELVSNLITRFTRHYLRPTGERGDSATNRTRVLEALKKLDPNKITERESTEIWKSISKISSTGAGISTFSAGDVKGMQALVSAVNENGRDLPTIERERAQIKFDMVNNFVSKYSDSLDSSHITNMAIATGAMSAPRDPNKLNSSTSGTRILQEIQSLKGNALTVENSALIDDLTTTFYSPESNGFRPTHLAGVSVLVAAMNQTPVRTGVGSEDQTHRDKVKVKMIYDFVATDRSFIQRRPDGREVNAKKVLEMTMNLDSARFSDNDLQTIDHSIKGIRSGGFTDVEVESLQKLIDSLASSTISTESTSDSSYRRSTNSNAASNLVADFMSNNFDLFIRGGGSGQRENANKILDALKTIDADALSPSENKRISDMLGRLSRGAFTGEEVRIIKESISAANETKLDAYSSSNSSSEELTGTEEEGAGFKFNLITEFLFLEKNNPGGFSFQPSNDSSETTVGYREVLDLIKSLDEKSLNKDNSKSFLDVLRHMNRRSAEGSGGGLWSTGDIAITKYLVDEINQSSNSARTSREQRQQADKVSVISKFIIHNSPNIRPPSAGEIGALDELKRLDPAAASVHGKLISQLTGVIRNSHFGDSRLNAIPVSDVYRFRYLVDAINDGASVSGNAEFGQKRKLNLITDVMMGDGGGISGYPNAHYPINDGKSRAAKIADVLMTIDPAKLSEHEAVVVIGNAVRNAMNASNNSDREILELKTLVNNLAR
jgi:hypothetical protein